MATYKVTAKSGIHLRSKPNGTILKTIPSGKTVSGDGKKQGGWYHIKYNGKWGWSYGQYLKAIVEKKKTVVSIAAKKKNKKKTSTKKKTNNKKKTNEKKGRAKARGTLGCWGTDLIFEVNSEKILTPRTSKYRRTPGGRSTMSFRGCREENLADRMRWASHSRSRYLQNTA